MPKLSQYNGKEWIEIKAHDPTDEELLSLIRPLIPEPVSDDHLLSLIRPLIPKVKDGKTPTKEELVSLIKPLIPEPVKPKDGKNGKDGKDGSPDTPDEVVNKVNQSEKQIESKRVAGLDDVIKSVDNIGKFSSGKGSGGRAPIVIQGAGTKLSDHVTTLNFSTNLTAVYSGNGVVTVTGTGGGSIDGSGTANEITYWVDSDTLGSLATATYPSLTELSRVKGVTSAIQTQLDAKAADSAVVHDTGDETIAGVKTFSSDPIIPDEAYDATAWNGSLEPPTKNAVRDKIEAMLSSSGITRTVVVTSGSATMGSSASTDYAYFVAGAHTMSLPAASGNTNRYTVKNNHSANITIDTAGAETVEGAASISIAPEESVDILSNGTNWFVI